MIKYGLHNNIFQEIQSNCTSYYTHVSIYVHKVIHFVVVAILKSSIDYMLLSKSVNLNIMETLYKSKYLCSICPLKSDVNI